MSEITIMTEIKDGWQLVGQDDRIGRGDLMLACDARSWVTQGWDRDYDGTPWTPRLVSENLKNPVFFIRKTTPANGWISVKDRLPDSKDTALFVCFQSGAVNFWYRWHDLAAVGVTHWQPCQLPAPPQPEPTEAEKAWSEHEKDYKHEYTGQLECVKRGFLAGFTAAQEGRGKV